MLATEKIVPVKTIVVAGIDTHKDTHHAAVLDLQGRVLGVQAFPVSTAGYQQLLEWIGSHGVIDRVGIELTGSYGAGLTRFLSGVGVEVIEVNTTDKATRARRGKDDAIDAVAAAQKVLSGMADAVPKDTTGAVESVRILKLGRDSAVKTRTRTLNQLKDLRITAPAELREQLETLTLAAIVVRARLFRPDRTRITEPLQATKIAMKRLADRVHDLDTEIAATTKDLTALVEALAPTLLARPGIGVHTAAQFLTTIGTNIDRITDDAAFARMCGAAPIPVSSGKTTRLRLHRGGDRQANSALHIIVIGRFKNHPETQAYLAKKLAQGKSKRYVAREVFTILKSDLTTT